MKKLLLMSFLFCSFFAFGQTIEGVDEEHLVVSDTSKLQNATGIVKRVDTTLNTFPQTGTPRQTRGNARSSSVQRPIKRCRHVKLLLYGTLVYLVNALATTEPGIATSSFSSGCHLK